MTTSRCSEGLRPPRDGCCPHSTEPGWATSPRTEASAPTARCFLSGAPPVARPRPEPDKLLGWVSSLLPLGTAGIVASVVPLNDYAVVPLMVGLHRYLRTGQNLAESMRDVRLGLTGDQIQQATATSLVALGAG